ncbi:MAG: L-rhamnose mutarotase [Specibacter sp.]
MRVCFRSSIHPDRVKEYTRRHAEVWPEMLLALGKTGWHNYSLFLSEDGQLIGYLECESFETSLALMQLEEVNTRWQAHMSDLFDGDNPDRGFEVLPEVFNLERQLGAPYP